MTIESEKLAALENALLDHDGTVDTAEAQRFLVKWNALLPYLPGGEPSAAMIVDFQPTTDAQKQKVADIKAATLALVQEISAP